MAEEEQVQLNKMYVLYKSNGQVDKSQFLGFIQQGNNNVDVLFVSIEGKDVLDYGATALLTLPDGSVTTEAGELAENYEYADGQYADGYLFTLSQNDTKYYGIIYASIQLINAADNSIFRTYQVPLVVNKTNSDLDETLITLAQYNNLISYINNGANGHFLSIISVLASNRLSDLVGAPKVIYYSGEYYLCRVANPSSNHYDFEFEALTSSNRYVGSVNGDIQLSLVFTNTYRKRFALDSEVVKIDGDQSISGDKTFSGEIISEAVDGKKATIAGPYFLFEDEGGTNQTQTTFPRSGTAENIAYQSYVNDKASKKQAVCQFAVNDFAKASGETYYKQEVTLTGFISGSDLLILTWGNGFALCPIPTTGKGHAIGSFPNQSGNYQTVRVGYTLSEGNTKLLIELGADYTPIHNGSSGYVFCVKL